MIWFVKAHAHQPDSQVQIIPNSTQWEVTCVYGGCCNVPLDPLKGWRIYAPLLLEVLPTFLPQLSASLGITEAMSAWPKCAVTPGNPLLCSLPIQIQPAHQALLRYHPLPEGSPDSFLIWMTMLPPQAELPDKIKDTQLTLNVRSTGNNFS